MKIRCEWCGGRETPFRKLNPDLYGEDTFICEDCYKGLELEQRFYELEFGGEQ